jgi:hypothetical protein
MDLVELKLKSKRRRREEGKKGRLAKFNIDKQIAAWGRLDEEGG